MQVVFTKVDERRYLIALRRDGGRDVGPDVPARQGPGGWTVPHDLVHFAVEEQVGLRLGVFGQAAAGGLAFFAPAPADRDQHAVRRAERLSRAGRADIVRSERIASLIGPSGVVSAEAERAVGDPRTAAALRRRLEELTAQWKALPDGKTLTLTWPQELTIRNGRAPAARRGRGTRR